MILVTGGAGLVGTELIKQLLEEGKAVRAIYNKTIIKDISNPGLQQVHCDILDVMSLEEVMKDVEELYHCAGFVAFTAKNTSKLFKVNVEGTANVVNAALNAGVKKMLHVSSVSALGHHPGIQSPADENIQWAPESGNSKYAYSKYLGELEVWRGIAEGLTAVIVNPSLILGPGNWNEGSTEIFKSVYNELPWYTDGGTGFVDVRDVAKIMIALMGSGIASERFIISAENGRFRDVFSMMAKAFNKKPASKKITPLLAAVVWRLEAVKSMFTNKAPLITKETAASAIAVRYFDNSKLKRFLPSFSYHTIPETINYSCAALQQKLNTQ